jgi:hypothetical protein
MLFTMESKETYDFDGYETYSLNLRCQMLGKLDLQRLHSELENTSPLLFVENSNDCQVGVFEAIDMCSERHLRVSKQPITTRDENRPNQEEHTLTCISSFRDLQDTLRVIEPVAYSTQANKTTLDKIATR